MSDNVFTITRAVRVATPALIALWGPSGSGKTYSALKLARGLVGKDGKIGVIDTENGRAKFYADMVGGWEHLDLQPPFTSERYIAAMQAFEQAGGFGCVIVDSMTHVWEGEGGVLDQADKAGGVGLQKWAKPKIAYKKMLNQLLRAPFHVIFCLRSKEKVLQEGAGRDAKIIHAGLVPIAEKNFIYEMTVAVQLDPQSHLPVAPVKCPEDMAGAFPLTKPVDEETGAKIAEWVSGGEVFDHEAANLQKVARDVATMGSVRFRDYWAKLGKGERAILKPILAELQALCVEADREPDPASTEDGDPFTLGKDAA